MASKKKSTKDVRVAKAPANFIAGLAVVGIVVLAGVDLFQTNDVPSFIYIGLIGAALGAKFDDVADWFGGSKR